MLSLPRLPSGSPVALSLIGLNVLLYGAQWATNGGVTNLGILYGPAVMQGHWWRLVSSGFLHGNLLHIAFNMYLLYILGPQLEQRFGSLRFLLMYLGSLLGGSLAVMLFDWQQLTLGASAAALGLAGAMGVALHERGIKPQQSPVFGLVLLNLALPLLVPGISFWGHFGGILAGAIMGYVLIWIPARSKANTPGNTLSAGTATVVGLGILALLAGHMGGIPI